MDEFQVLAYNFLEEDIVVFIFCNKQLYLVAKIVEVEVFWGLDIFKATPLKRNESIIGEVKKSNVDLFLK